MLEVLEMTRDAEDLLLKLLYFIVETNSVHSQQHKAKLVDDLINEVRRSRRED
jgi:hypothetical protein